MSLSTLILTFTQLCHLSQGGDWNSIRSINNDVFPISKYATSILGLGIPCMCLCIRPHHWQHAHSSLCEKLELASFLQPPWLSNEDNVFSTMVIDALWINCSIKFGLYIFRMHGNAPCWLPQKLYLFRSSILPCSMCRRQHVIAMYLSWLESRDKGVDITHDWQNQTNGNLSSWNLFCSQGNPLRDYLYGHFYKWEHFL